MTGSHSSSISLSSLSCTKKFSPKRTENVHIEKGRFSYFELIVSAISTNNSKAGASTVSNTVSFTTIPSLINV